MNIKEDVGKEAYRLLETLGRYDHRLNEYFMLGFLSGSYKCTTTMMEAIVKKLKDDK